MPDAFETEPMNTDHPKPQKALELPTLSGTEFRRLIRSLLLNPNLGAGIAASGTSGSGKSNFSQWAILESLRLGIPFIHIDPHGDSARKLWRMCLALPKSKREKVIYWKVADPNAVAAIHPLSHDPHEDQLSEYERLSFGRIQVELTANIILAAVSEGGQGFAFRPVMRKWITRWLWFLWRAGLTLADAAMLLDPHHPVYELLVQLAPDDMARHQMLALPAMKVADMEAEIGSARNRITNVLEHPAGALLLSRRHNAIDFREIYESGMSLIVDLDKGRVLTDEVQRTIANVIFNQYIAVVLSTPEEFRRRRLFTFDEIAVLAESCGPLLERMCTEVRKFRTSFLLLAQGSARMPGRTENELFQTIFDMCRVKILFRHNIDAEFFGKQIALAAHQGPRIKHVQTTPQQFTVGHEVVELMDRGEGTADMEGATTTEGTTDQLTETLTTAVRQADQESRANASGRGTSRAEARQRTSTRTTNMTVKQTLVPKIVTKPIVNSVQFYSKEEIEWEGASTLKKLDTGEAVVAVDGQGVWVTKTPLALDSYGHAPQFAARKLREWREEILKRPEFASPAQLQAERQEFLTTLVRELKALSSGAPAQRLDATGVMIHTPASTPIIEKTPVEDDPRITL